MTEAAIATAPAAAPTGPVPTIGRIAHYRLSETDASRINERRESGLHIFLDRADNCMGLQGHVGNQVAAGGTYPMLIVAVWGDRPSSPVNGQVFLDGNDVHWATSVGRGDGPGTWSWPPRG